MILLLANISQDICKERPSCFVVLIASAVAVTLADLGRRHALNGLLHEHQPIYTHEHIRGP